jgi:hypothetical protein
MAIISIKIKNLQANDHSIAEKKSIIIKLKKMVGVEINWKNKIASIDGLFLPRYCLLIS